MATSIHPNHGQGEVESALLSVVAELHPTRLPANALIPRVLRNSNDPRQVRAVFAALGRLREYGVIADRDDGIVHLTPTALRTVALLWR